MLRPLAPLERPLETPQHTPTKRGPGRPGGWTKKPPPLGSPPLTTEKESELRWATWAAERTLKELDASIARLTADRAKAADTVMELRLRQKLATKHGIQF
jgi:hypothetical protein